MAMDVFRFQHFKFTGSGGLLGALFPDIASGGIVGWATLALAAGSMIRLVMLLSHLFFGTPIIEHRIIQIMGLALLLPYLARCVPAIAKAVR
ncbi:MAG: hypothetical protein CALGDGBN_02339 [Pseudomonadales bacterium]|nr:hypothetical protein [Pseudomonadales bacterium]